MTSIKPLAASMALLIAGLAAPYSASLQGSSLALVENSAACAEEGGTCRDAGCRNGDQTCAVLPSGTVCLDHGGDDQPAEPTIS